MKKQAMFILFVMFAVAGVWAQGSKVPAEIGVRIRNIQLDQSRIQTQMLQLQSQYQTLQGNFSHDNDELDSLKKEALTAGKQDAATTDVDLDKLEFVAKQTPKPQPEVKK